MCLRHLYVCSLCTSRPVARSRPNLARGLLVVHNKSWRCWVLSLGINTGIRGILTLKSPFVARRRSLIQKLYFIRVVQHPHIWGDGSG